MPAETRSSRGSKPAVRAVTVGLCVVIAALASVAIGTGGPPAG